jgi:hypothetical protein
MVRTIVKIIALIVKLSDPFAGATCLQNRT